MGQFGVGTMLGAGYRREDEIAGLKVSDLPPRPNFLAHAERFAAMYASQNIFSEPPRVPLLTVDDVVEVCGIRRSEAEFIPKAFIDTYGTGPDFSRARHEWSTAMGHIPR